jgi:hypothetical protein
MPARSWIGRPGRNERNDTLSDAAAMRFVRRAPSTRAEDRRRVLRPSAHRSAPIAAATRLQTAPRRAIQADIGPEHRVLDFGVGTATLSLLASNSCHNPKSQASISTRKSAASPERRSSHAPWSFDRIRQSRTAVTGFAGRQPCYARRLSRRAGSLHARRRDVTHERGGTWKTRGWLNRFGVSYSSSQTRPAA